MNAAGRFELLAPGDLQVLKERARELAKAPAADHLGERLEVLTVRSREHTFALPLSSVDGVSELLSVAPVPRAPPLVRGLVAFRGELMLGVELSILAGAGGSGIADLTRMVCLSAEGRKLALLAERTLHIEAVPQGSFLRDTVAQLPFVVGTDERFVSLLDPRALIDHVFAIVGELRP